MAEPVVQTSTRLWSEEVARADAPDLEAQRPPVVYEFAGGRALFRDGQGPSGPPAA